MDRTRSLLIAAVAAAGLVGAGCSTSAEVDETTRDDSGAISEGGELGVFEIEVGDCFDVGDADEVETVDAIPCDQPHVYEAFATFDLTGDEYPGDDVVGEQAGTGCIERFEAYVGAPYETSSLFVFPISPSEQTWEDQDDREVICTLVTEDQSPRTGSAEGSGI